MAVGEMMDPTEAATQLSKRLDWAVGAALRALDPEPGVRTLNDMARAAALAVLTTLDPPSKAEVEAAAEVIKDELAVENSAAQWPYDLARLVLRTAHAVRMGQKP